MNDYSFTSNTNTATTALIHYYCMNSKIKKRWGWVSVPRRWWWWWWVGDPRGRRGWLLVRALRHKETGRCGRDLPGTRRECQRLVMSLSWQRRVVWCGGPGVHHRDQCYHVSLLFYLSNYSTRSHACTHTDTHGGVWIFVCYFVMIIEGSWWWFWSVYVNVSEDTRHRLL